MGALLALILLLFTPAVRQNPARVPLSHWALDGFAAVGSTAVGSAAVAGLIASGLVNSWALVGLQNLGSALTTLYGQLLIAKLAIFGLMVILAGANRFYLSPALSLALATGDTGVALQSLRRSLALESALGLVILGLVAGLGLLASPASAM